MMIAVAVRDQSQVAEARRRAAAMAEAQDFGATDAGRVALVATELATNLLKHGGGGEILIGSYTDPESSGIELLALDKGPGMADVEACLRDGYSSSGTSGHGLGAIIRQSHFVDIASAPGSGTAVLARLTAGTPARARPQQPSAWGAVSVPMPGQDVCGDSWTVSQEPEGQTVMVVDGLGHGPEAAEASVEAVRLFHRYNGHRVPTLLDYVHGGLRATRGAAVSIARCDRAAGRIIFSGIGNVAGVIAARGETRRMVSMAGTAGYNARKIQAFDYPFDSGLVILHSDGLSSNWTLDRIANAPSLHPTLLAALLYRDFARHRDDATVLVAKW